ncbi:hypothetical protein EPO05_00585 [Patescibacteria group bacterium]|nr:MAG: hypothetical protein EPO05_00585 [Patescibacteria group bacterium]
MNTNLLSSVVRPMVVMMFVMVAGLACAANNNLAGHGINPLGDKIEGIEILGPEATSPYVIRIVLRSNHPVKAKAFWNAGLEQELGDGLKIVKMDGRGHTSLITLDMKKVMESLETFRALKLFVGFDNSGTGYPNYRQLLVREQQNVPKDMQGTPLEVVLLKWNYDGQRFEDELVVSAGFLN